MVVRNEEAVQGRSCLLPVTIEAIDLPDAFFQVIRNVMLNGYRYEVQRGSYEDQERIELDFATVHIKDPGSGDLLPKMPEGSSLPPIADETYVKENYFPIYLLSNHKAEGEQYTYGERINQIIPDSHLKVEKSQIDWAIEILTKTPNTNQATIEIGQPTDITIRDKHGHPDPPCLRLIDCRVRYDKLHLMVYFRSWDAWGGFPVNMAGIELLKQYMADAIGVGNGELVAASKGLHVYGYAEDIAKMRAHVL